MWTRGKDKTEAGKFEFSIYEGRDLIKTVGGFNTAQEADRAAELEQRMAMLAARADPAMRATLERQTSRLAAADQMGNLFKVVSATSQGLATPYPFGRR